MVRLDDFAVFVNGGGADDGQIAVRQFGFSIMRIRLPNRMA